MSDYIEFIGEIKPGERLLIDTHKLSITINGKNVRHMMQGDFFELVPGENIFIYTDDEVERSLLIRVTYKDIFL